MVDLEELRAHYAELPTWQLQDIRREAYRFLAKPGLPPEHLAQCFMSLGLVEEQLVLRGIEPPRSRPIYMNGAIGPPAPIDD